MPKPKVLTPKKRQKLVEYIDSAERLLTFKEVAEAIKVPRLHVTKKTIMEIYGEENFPYEKFTAGSHKKEQRGCLYNCDGYLQIRHNHLKDFNISIGTRFAISKRELDNGAYELVLTPTGVDEEYLEEMRERNILNDMPPASQTKPRKRAKRW